MVFLYCQAKKNFFCVKIVFFVVFSLLKKVVTDNKRKGEKKGKMYQ